MVRSRILGDQRCLFGALSVIDGASQKCHFREKNTDEHMVGIHVMSGVSWSFYDLPCDPFFGASNARDGRSFP